MTLNFDQFQRYSKFIERDQHKLMNSKWFCQKPERLRKVIAEKPPYMLYRCRVLGKDFIGMIEGYNVPASEIKDEEVDIIFYCPKEWNQRWLKDRRFLRVKPHELEPITHRRVAQIELERKGIKWTGIRFPLEVVKKEHRVIL
jgi:hypothetical protein